MTESDLSLSHQPADEELLQPSDSDGPIPPTFSGGNLPRGGPIEAVLRARPKFYGPVNGPFAIHVVGDILQVGEDWRGYIRQMPDGTVLHIHEQQFERHYEVIDAPITDEGAVITRLTEELDAAREQIEQLKADAHLVVHQAEADELDAEEPALTNDDLYDEDAEQEAAETRLIQPDDD